MIVPLVLGGIVLYAVLRKRGGDTDTGSEDDAPNVPVTAWNSAWGTQNEWDKRYPNTPVNKPLSVDWAQFDPVFAGKVKAAFAELEAQGFDPFVFEGARTQQRQAYLYGQGRPDYTTYGRAGSKITWTLSASKHGTYPARAVDVISKSTYWKDPAFFAAWGKAAQAQGLRWLGPTDQPHAELV